MSLFRSEALEFAKTKAQAQNPTDVAVAVYQANGQVSDPIQLFDAPTGQTEVFGVTTAGAVKSQPAPVVYSSSADAITFPFAQNVAVIDRSGGVDATTLATPAAADSGKTLIIINGTTEANTVTTATGVIQNGGATAHKTITFAAYEGGSVSLTAYFDGTNGYWCLGWNNGGTLS